MQPEDFRKQFYVSRETMERLVIYERLLREWGQGLSLVGRSTLDDIWLRHFADSAQLYQYVNSSDRFSASRPRPSPSPYPLPRGEGLSSCTTGNSPLPVGEVDRHAQSGGRAGEGLIPPAQPILDMGTGGGFPGMVLAIMGASDVHLSDNNQKKIEFLHVVAAQTDTQVTIHNCKVEAVPDLHFNMLLARGLAPLNDLLALSARLMRRDTVTLFLKGRKAQDEVDEARRRWSFTCDCLPSLTSEDSFILRLSHLTRREAA